MNLWIRLLMTVLRARLGASLEALDTAVTPFRVWPHDLDVNLHMNNGRYATLMDLGRVDLMARSGLLAKIARARLMPVVTAQHLTYRRSLDPFQSFRIHTRVLGWDERSIYLEQVFVRGKDDEFCARGIAQTLFLRAGKRLPSDEVARLFGLPETMPVPEDVRAMFPAPGRARGHASPSRDVEAAKLA